MKRIDLSLLILLAVVIGACQNAPQQKVAEPSPEISKTSTDVILKDYGAAPLVVNIDDYTLSNENFRTTLWTGEYLQVTLMAIPVGGEVGLELHNDIDQFLRIEEGSAEVLMGDKEDELTYKRTASEDDAIFVPAGKWHNVINTGDKPLKLYSIYAPQEHPHGTVHIDKAASDADEHEH